MIIGIVALAFIVGSVPVGYWVGLARGIDIRKLGSGNIGATNVHRILGAKWGLIVFLLDVGKGLLPALVCRATGTSQEVAFVVGLVAVAGHCLSPFVGFKGGKGIATGLGALFGASPLAALSAFGVFLLMLAITRYVSVSSMVAAAAVVPLGLLFGDSRGMTAASVALALFVFWRHVPNIKRLLSGEEPRFRLSSRAVQEPTK